MGRPEHETHIPVLDTFIDGINENLRRNAIATVVMIVGAFALTFETNIVVERVQTVSLIMLGLVILIDCYDLGREINSKANGNNQK